MPRQPDEIFEGNRPRLTKIAYRMLGTVSDGEDAVQDTWLRWHNQCHDDIKKPDAFLTTTLVRRFRSFFASQAAAAAWSIRAG